jgi:hypothetical protein
MNHDKNCCKTCAFWHLQPIADGQHQCRRHAPVKGEQGIRDAFPLTRSYDWCGDWEHAPALAGPDPQWPACEEPEA